MRSHVKHLERARAQLNGLHEEIETLKDELMRLVSKASKLALALQDAHDEYAKAEKAKLADLVTNGE